MADSFDVDKIVAAILAAAKVSHGNDQSATRYVRIYEEMYQALAERGVGQGAAVMRAVSESMKRSGDT